MTQRFETIEGTVDRIIGSHDDTDVSIQSSGHHYGDGPHVNQVHVNTSREYTAIFEVAGRTVRLSDAQPIVVARGDTVQVVVERRKGGPWEALGFVNKTRDIRVVTIRSRWDALQPGIGLIGIALFAAIFVLTGWSGTFSFVLSGILALIGGYGLVHAVTSIRAVSAARKHVDELLGPS